MAEDTDLLCSTVSRQAGEQLFGTVKPTDAWLLLEYDTRWGPEAFEDSDLPEAVKTRLQTHLDAIPRSKLLMIRQKPRLAAPGIWFFVGLSREHDPALYAFRLDAYDDLLALDIPAICAQDPAYDDHRQAEPLFLVCTHGRHDRCCARYGVAVYERMAADVGAAVWQSSHVGGHRFAANMISLPHGVFYGYLEADRVPAVLDAVQGGQVALDFYRGRVCYPQVAQAADYYLRAETGLMDLDAYRFADAERTDSNRWIVRFVARTSGDTHDVTLAEDRSSVKTYGSCGDAQPSPVTQYRLLRHDVIPAVD